MPKKHKEKKIKILAAGDFHGDSKVAKRLAEKAEKEKVDLVILIGDVVGLLETKDIIKPFIDKKKKVLFVPGNWESREATETLKKLYGVRNVEDHYLVYDDIGVFGVGSADWKLNLDDGKTFRDLKKDFDKMDKRKDLEKKILVSHVHAAGTKSEFSGFPGSKDLRKAIEKFQPDVFLSGHIHEGEGLRERIGKTRVYNIGKKGKIIEV
jgi:Icc-related predicted phosphoesterase